MKKSILILFACLSTIFMLLNFGPGNYAFQAFFFSVATFVMTYVNEDSEDLHRVIWGFNSIIWLFIFMTA